MKKSLLFVFLFFSLYARAQYIDYAWARNSVSSGHTYGEGMAVATDKQDNVYVTGFFNDTITFGPYTMFGPAVFLTKYDGNGNVLWTRCSGSSNGKSYVATTDNSGNVYVTGMFSDTLRFSSYTLVSASASIQDIFIVKYDPSGNVLWAIRGGGTVTEGGAGIACDPSENVYLTCYSNSPSFSIGTLTLANSGTNEAFLVKLDSSGNARWIRRSTSMGVNQANATSRVCADASGHVYITGACTKPSITFGSLTLNIATSGIYVVQYDTAGNALWVRGASASLSSSIATDQLNNIYVTGGYSTTATFGSVNISNAGSNAYVADYDSAGNVRWAKSINNGSPQGYCIAAAKGKVYVSGTFLYNSTSVTFDTITILRPSPSPDPMFFAGYNSSGGILFAKALPSGGDDNNYIAAAPQGCIYLAGDFMQTPFVLGNTSLVSPTGFENVFIAKLCTAIMADFGSSDSVFCNESGACIDFFDHSSGTPTSWKWNFPGAVPDTSTQQNPINICYYTPGTYAVTLVVNNSNASDSLTVSSMITFASSAAPPVLNFSGDTIYCSHAVAYQWFLNGSPITSATDSFYVLTGDGLYAVQITDGNGCTRLSDGFPVLVNELSGASAIKIYPNPARDQFTVYSLQFTIGTTLEVYNVLGEKVFSTLPNNNQETLNPPKDGSAVVDCKIFPAGVYIITVNTPQGSVNKRLIIQK